MKKEILQAAKTALAENSIYNLFSEKIGVPEDVEDSTAAYALMFNVENSEMFFLNYATSENSWAITAQQQNPWFLLGYVSATDILMCDALSDELSDELERQTDAEDES